MYNKIILLGNLGSDPELRYMSSGDPVCNFSVATNRRFVTRDGENREETNWFRVNAWGKLAETCNQYLEKGRLVYVEGQLNLRDYTTADGELRSSLDVRALEIKFLSGNGPTDGPDGEQNEASGGSTRRPAAASSGAAAPAAAPASGDERDLPW